MKISKTVTPSVQISLELGKELQSIGTNRRKWQLRNLSDCNVSVCSHNLKVGTLVFICTVPGANFSILHSAR